MKILILNGSPHPKGNTKALVDAFTIGAQSAGHTVLELPVGTMNIKGCLGCEYCHKKGEGKCVQRDDMDKVYPELATADMIVFASPVHYFGFSGQMESAISRFYAPFQPAAGIEAQYKTMVGFFKAEDMGILEVVGDENQSEAALKKAEMLGAKV